MVHQHFMLVPPLSVAENLMLGAESTFGPGVLDLERVRRRVRELSSNYGLPVDRTRWCATCRWGVQQRVEILKALYRQARVLILDEPTAVLTPQEALDLFRVMSALRTEQNTSIVFITHKLHEVFEVADRIVVLRQGKVVGSLRPTEATEESLAAMMVGRPVLLRVDKEPARPGEVALRLRDLQVLSDRGLLAVNDLSLEVRSGEILGIAGVQGNGQTELVEALTGLRTPIAGTIELLVAMSRAPRHVSWSTLARRTSRGPPEAWPGTELPRRGQPGAAQLRPTAVRAWVVHRARGDSALCAALTQEFDIRTRSVRQLASTLSGGNQQKVIVCPRVHAQGARAHRRAAYAWR